ncbi:hypothetical protein KI387_034635, partial [Taxus chinensis]
HRSTSRISSLIWLGQHLQCRGLMEFLCKAIQTAYPYHQNYLPGNQYWPRIIQNPLFGPPQTTEQCGLLYASAFSKHYATEEIEVGSPKFVSLSQGLTDQIISQSWNPSIDNDFKELVDIADKKYPHEKRIRQTMQNNSNAKDLQKTKMASMEGWLKPTESLEKRKADTSESIGTKKKFNTFAKAQLCAEKLHTFNAVLQKSKEEK